MTGPGEQGSAVILSAEEEKKKDELYKVNGFNALVSDKISLDRSLQDIRHPELVSLSASLSVCIDYSMPLCCTCLLVLFVCLALLNVLFCLFSESSLSLCG